MYNVTSTSLAHSEHLLIQLVVLSFKVTVARLILKTMKRGNGHEKQHVGCIITWKRSPYCGTAASV